MIKPKATIIVLMGFFFASCLCDSYSELLQKKKSGELRKACHKRVNIEQPPTRVNTTERLANLRRLMVTETATRHKSLDAYIIPSQDDHQNEFLDDYDKRRQYISGFSGSYGDAVVTATKAVLWTDGRYYLQANDQIDCNWFLINKDFYDVLTIPQWLKKEFPSGALIGVDPKLIAQSIWRQYNRELRPANITLVAVEINLIDLLWNETNGRSAKRNKDVFTLDEQYTGKSWTTKLEELRSRLRDLSVDAMVVTALDEIAWLLNIRSRDIPYSPFVRSYLIVDMFGVMFYVNESQLRKNHIKKHFEQTRGHTRNTVKIKDYNAICNDLKTFSQVYKKILIPSHYVYSLGASRYISNCTNHEKKMLHHQSPIIEMKAKKNPTEIEGMYNAHIRDAAAMCEFFSYFESRVNAGDHFTELDIVKKLNEFRFEQKYSLGNSFRTIAAYGSNGARPHYEPTPNTNAKISKDKTLVLDSGGQYFDGTTDVTRTLHLGTPTKEQKNAYTRVLIGQIQLSTLTFPENMKTSVADVMARAPLWEVGLDYSHPTSHGIGSFLSVHESPISVYFDDPSFHQKLKPGYFLSNEPGFYKEDDFGIRLENVMEVVEKNLPRVDGISFLGFKVVTLVPYEPKLIDLSLLSFRQRKWLNFYNDQIRRHVGRELRNQNFINGYNWMMEKTKSIPEYGHGNVVRSYSLFVLSANAVVIFMCSDKIFI